jgi:hypothetical protein
MWIQFLRPRASGRMAFSAQLLDSSNSGYCYHGYEIEEYNGGYWVHLHGNPVTIGYKTLKSAEDFVDWLEGHKLRPRRTGETTCRWPSYSLTSTFGSYRFAAPERRAE